MLSYDGPGKPGPGDDWKFPTGPLNEVDGEEEVTVEPLHSSGTVFLPLHPTDKR